MLLISESAHEDQYVLPICALLQDLGLTIQPFERKEALATVFWDISEVFYESSWLQNLSNEEKEQFLSFLELEIRSAMIIAGFQAMEKGISTYINVHS